MLREPLSGSMQLTGNFSMPDVERLVDAITVKQTVKRFEGWFLANLIVAAIGAIVLLLVIRAIRSRRAAA